MQRKKNWKKTGLKQCTKEVKSKRCCRRQSTWLIIALLSNRYRSAVAPISLCCPSVVAPLSHRYRTAIVPLSLRHCRSVATLLSHRYCTGIAPLLLRCCFSCCRYAVTLLSHRYRSTVATPLSLRCRASVTPLLYQYRSTGAPLLSLLLLLRSHTVIAPLSPPCRFVAVAPAIATQSLPPLHFRFCSH